MFFSVFPVFLAALFAPNVLAEAAASMPGVSLDPGGSRLLQALLPHAPLGVLGRFLSLLVAGGLGGPAGHPLGARVLEAALGRVVAVLGGQEEEEEEGAVGRVEEAVGHLAAQIGGDLVAFAQHPAGSFVVRGLLRCPFLIGHGLVLGLQDGEKGRLLEAAMTVAGPRPLRELFQRDLRGRLRGVATHRLANHGLQRLLDHAPEDVVGPSLGPVTLQGSLVLQHLLHFGDPGPVLGSLEALPPQALVALACSPPGSRVWDALLASPTVPPRARRRLLRKLKGHFLSLACHRNGSRVLDAVWASASAPARAAIAEELAPQRQALRRDPHGRGVARTMDLDLFLRRRKAWERLQEAQGGKRGLLGPLLLGD
ncbi:PREDICTED: nucleolar protein 9 [Calidris pugnax]|uniref:nucleolar protein 9 n=1 Tax=Calidris pugnax TaxID=198806 RepID=UPI00071C3CAE|nr:PREDICTED: nucleolar protein 9 [Calidris pugnax]